MGRAFLTQRGELAQQAGHTLSQAGRRGVWRLGSPGGLSVIASEGAYPGLRAQRPEQVCPSHCPTKRPSSWDKTGPGSREKPQVGKSAQGMPPLVGSCSLACWEGLGPCASLSLHPEGK